LERTVHILIWVLLGGLIVLSPLAMGAVAPWARSAVLISAMLLLTLWLVQALREGRLRIIRTRAWLFILAFFFVLMLQVLPLPAHLVELISPATSAALRESGAPVSGTWATLSLHPYGTCWEIARIASIAIIFLIVAHTATSSRRVLWLLIPLAAVALFECLYGFAEQFSGHRAIFWNPRVNHLGAVTGTFLNKNHFAGLLEMALPATIGLLLGILARKRPAKFTRAHVLSAVSSSRAFLPMVLAFSIVIMATAICLSLSRAGILCALISVVLLAISLSLSFGFRRYTLALLGLVAAMMISISLIGTEVIVERMEDAATGRSASWTDRINLAQSGLNMARDFPLFGSGLGSFRYVFEKYQSARFGDRVADYLHNDWLQLICEAGLVGGLMAAGAAFILLFGSSRRALARRDPFCRWVSIGALSGAAVMLVHSLFDFNLMKITSNGIVFAVLLGIGFSAARMRNDGRRADNSIRFITVRLGPAPLRAALALLLVVGLFAVTLPALRIARADIAANRFAAGSGVDKADKYFFLPLDPAIEASRAEQELALAMQLDPHNSGHRFLAALYCMKKADKTIEDEARRAAQAVATNVALDPSDEMVTRLAALMTRNDKAFSTAQREQILADAEIHAAEALDRLPVASFHHLLLAQINAATARARPAQSAADWDQAVIQAEHAVRLAPNKPEILFNAGEVLLEASLAGALSETETLRAGLACLKQAIAADPRNTDKAFRIAEVFQRQGISPTVVTPNTLRAQQRLSDYLWRNGDWRALLACLARMEELCNGEVTRERLSPWILARNDATGDTDPSASESLSATANQIWQSQDLQKMRLALSQRRAAVLGILGRWEERDAAVESCRLHLRELARGPLQQAVDFKDRGGIERAYEAVTEILTSDWANPEALLLAADLAHRLDKPSIEPCWDGALDHLYRLVILNDRLPEEVYPAVCALLERLPRRNSSEETQADFIRGAVALLTGRSREAEKELTELTQRIAASKCDWRQRHLPAYYLGLALEKNGDTTSAARAYQQALKELPDHLPSIRRLCALNEIHGGHPLLAQLNGITPCNITYGGKLRLLGYRIENAGGPANDGDAHNRGPAMTCYWEFLDRMPNSYRPSIQFCDADWKTLLQPPLTMVLPGGERYPLDYGRSGEPLLTSTILRDEIWQARYMRIEARDSASPVPARLITKSGINTEIIGLPLHRTAVSLR
jgi:O-antigen ligase/tetratricopeptide (TPR) repeat protein